MPVVNPPRRIAFLELEQKFAFFKGLPRSMKAADIRIAFATFKALIQTGRTNNFFTYSTEDS
jgi:hypothetical protein